MADETLLTELNRRFLQSESFSNYLLREFGYPNLESAYKAARLILLDEGDITSVTKLNRITAELNRTITPETTAMFTSMTAELNSFGAAEAVWLASTLSEFAAVNLKKPAKQKTIEYIERSIMSLESGTSSVAGTWSEFVKENTDNLSKTIVNQVKTGYSNGETTQAIVRRIKAATDGVSKNSIERLVRTGTNHYSQQARAYMAQDNEDVIATVVPVITFDSRTSNICISISQKYGDGWPYGKNPIGSVPPWHMNCRSTLVYLPAGVELEGTRPAIYGRKGKAGEEAFERKTGTPKKYTGRRDSAFMAEQIPVGTPYSMFLRDQPKWFVRQVLGKTKADAFLAGELDLSNLTGKGLKARSLEDLGLK